MTESVVLAPLGVYAVTVAILLAILRVVWRAYEKERDGRIEDQKVVLPAISESTSAVIAAVKAIDHVTRLYDSQALPRGREPL